MSIDKRISEFDIIEEFDITTKIPIIQGSPLKNGIITPKDFVKAIADKILGELNLSKVDNTTDLEKPISTATQEAFNRVVSTMVTLTETEYNALAYKNPNTYYFIKED